MIKGLTNKKKVTQKGMNTERERELDSKRSEGP
jgi:hypothetical protein